MFEDDDFLPEESESLPAEDETVEEPTEEPETEETDDPTSEAGEPVQETEETPPAPQMVKIKVDREEREITLDEALTLAQKGTNYERAIERARNEAAQQAKDALIADMGYTWNGKPITTEAEYKQALSEQKIIEQYQDRELPPEIIKELVESRRDREERRAEKERQSQEQEKQQALGEFFEYFESVNGRQFDPQKDNIPQDVIDAANGGQRLLYAYMQHHNKQLMNQLKIAKQNETNMKRSPVKSTTSNGASKATAKDEFLLGFDEY